MALELDCSENCTDINRCDQESFLRDGWFTERWYGYGMSLKIKRSLHAEKSPFQTIEILESTDYGNIMVLDGITQCSEADEFIYQEMMAHVPLCSHPNPKKVLIIGGGDGGVLREVVKHSCVQTAQLCEIDERVIALSKEYFPAMSVGYSSDKASVSVADGFEFLREHTDEFDVIITDSSDNLGPNETLFGAEYYKLVRKSLKENGILCFQGATLWLDTKNIRDLVDMCRNIFPVVRYSSLQVPTYPSGQIGMIVCSKSQWTKFEAPLRMLSEEIQRELKYYTSQIHSASFVLPPFANQLIYGKSQPKDWDYCASTDLQ